jgi:hypothetical protein
METQEVMTIREAIELYPSLLDEKVTWGFLSGGKSMRFANLCNLQFIGDGGYRTKKLVNENKIMKRTITWSAEDIATVKPDWTEEQCEEWLDDNWGHIQDRMIELGWEVIDCSLPQEEETK